MKGQAFDVFKLVIAAAVGMIMLGLLLSILGGIRPPGGDPVSVTQNLLRETYFQGIQKTSASPVTFTKDLKFTVSSLVRGTGIPEDKVEIDTANCASGLTCTSTDVVATSDVTVKVVVDCLQVSTSRCQIRYVSAV
jgi:hypothetical protein